MTKIIYPKDHKIILRAADGPFNCGNCEHWNLEDSCSEEHIIDLASGGKYRLELDEENNASPLYEEDCCDFFEKKGKK